MLLLLVCSPNPDGSSLISLSRGSCGARLPRETVGLEQGRDNNWRVRVGQPVPGANNPAFPFRIPPFGHRLPVAPSFFSSLQHSQVLDKQYPFSFRTKW